jgi:hypothetical protein
MRPKIFEELEWNKMLRKYDTLTLKGWNYLDGVKKLSILRGAKVNIKSLAIFGNFSNLVYPKSIYNFEKCKKHIFDVTTLNKMRHVALEERKEIGGVVDINKEMKFLFMGSNNRIDLNFENKDNKDNNDKKNVTLFHTHPQDEDVEYDPPSILDIVSFLEFNVKSMADRILNKNIGEILKIQNSIVFTKNEVYIYYLSNDVIINIVKYLLNLFNNFKNNNDFVYEVEKLLEEIELYYSSLLSRFNMTLTNSQVEEYLSYLQTLGIVIQRFKYTESVEIFTFS